LLIPRNEVERFLARASEYNPQSKEKKVRNENGGEK